MTSTSAVSSTFDVNAVRSQFPALAREIAGQPAAYFDGPAGSQVPLVVADAMRECLLHTNANTCGQFATSREVGELAAAAHAAAADFLGGGDPDEDAFGPNMTTLTFAFSRALAQEWKQGDEIIVTQSDHDANVTPWVLAARDAGVTVRHVPINKDDCTLDLEAYRALLNERTRLVAFGCASNASGTIHPIKEMTAAAHEAGAEVFLDAVHFAPHLPIDVAAWNCDFLACSAYKFFGPHIGMLWGRRDRLEEIKAYKVRPAPDDLPGKWMTGTLNFEGVAGTLAAINYLAGLSGENFPALEPKPSAARRQALLNAYDQIARYEQPLALEFLAGLAEIPEITVWGITDAARIDQRVPTISFTHKNFTPQQVAKFLGDRGIFVWDGNYYAVALTETLGLEPEGAVRVGILHYNTQAEVQRLLAALRELNE